jgi:hypothetical protein
VKGRHLHHRGLRRVVLVQDCTWRSGTCFGTSINLIFVQMIFRFLFFHFHFEVRAGNTVTEKPGGQKAGGYPLAADPRTRETLAACTKTRLPTLRGQTKRLAEPGHSLFGIASCRFGFPLLRSRPKRLVEPCPGPLSAILSRYCQPLRPLPMAASKVIPVNSAESSGDSHKPLDKLT